MTGFICVGQPQYGWDKKLEALDGVAYANFRDRARSCRDKLPKSNIAGAFGNLWFNELLMDEDEVDAWNSIDVKVEIHRMKGLASNARQLPETIYQISVANVGLMQIELVDYLEDCCTDQLQNYLDRGWRILAVCPPNDARRPTYIIGHTNRKAHD